MISTGDAIRISFEAGQPVIDAAAIAPLLELDVVSFQVLMQAGDIGTGVERGTGADHGRLRLTFQSPGWRVRLTCAQDGQVISVARVKLTQPDAAQDAGEQMPGKRG